MSAPAAWLADPTGRHQLRYWDGSRWTEHVADAGVTSRDPLSGPAQGQGAASQSGGAWTDKVKSAAQQAAEAAGQAMDKAGDAINQQAEQWKQRPAQTQSPQAYTPPTGATATPAHSSPPVQPQPSPEPVLPESSPAPFPPSAPPTVVGGSAVAAGLAAADDDIPAPGTVADQLMKLAELRDRGVLTEEEFQTQKAKVLDS